MWRKQMTVKHRCMNPIWTLVDGVIYSYRPERRRKYKGSDFPMLRWWQLLDVSMPRDH